MCYIQKKIYIWNKLNKPKQLSTTLKHLNYTQTIHTCIHTRCHIQNVYVINKYIIITIIAWCVCKCVSVWLCARVSVVYLPFFPVSGLFLYSIKTKNQQLTWNWPVLASICIVCICVQRTVCRRVRSQLIHRIKLTERFCFMFYFCIFVCSIVASHHFVCT